MATRQPMSPGDVTLQAGLASVLARFPALRAIVPANFPTDSRYDVTVHKMQEYSDDRTKTYWHKINLPLALHAYGYSPEPFLHELLGSMLNALDDFCARLGHLPGARSLLAPLWNNAWQDTPEAWSIASCVYMALCYEAAGFAMTGFERCIGAGPRDADITVELKSGITTHVDVEAFHKPEFGSKTDEEIRDALEVRAHHKASAKFRDLPPGEVGIVAEVAIVSIEDVGRRFERTPMRPPRPVTGLANRFWMPLRLVGVRAPDLRFILDEL